MADHHLQLVDGVKDPVGDPSMHPSLWDAETDPNVLKARLILAERVIAAADEVLDRWRMIRPAGWPTGMGAYVQSRDEYSLFGQGR